MCISYNNKEIDNMPESLQKKSEFDEIRPYSDEEVKAVVHKLIPDPSFQKFIQYLFPNWNSESTQELLTDVSTIKGFQKLLMYPAAKTVAERTTSNISVSGFDTLEQHKSYLFVSNHRDIILDSAFLNMLLFEQKLDTCEVAIGSNLLIQPWIKHLVRLNKNFIVHRDVPSKKLYEYSLRLSNYIRQSLDKGSSVWIAQKEGRTKDGNDRTQAGLLKMLSISGQTDLLDNLRALNITPLAISYEYEPCDYMKAREIYLKATTGSYKKTQDDDLKSMFTGLTAFKGRVHFAMGASIKEKMELISNSASRNDSIKAVAEIINQEIYRQYHLWPSNYIAHDLLHNQRNHKEKYTQQEKTDFLQHLENALQKIEEPAAAIKEIMLKIYATPVENKIQHK